MAKIYIISLYLIAFVVIQIASQTVWVDIDTGKVLGVSQGQGQQQQRVQQQYPQGNNGYHHRRHRWRQPSVGNQLPVIQQFANPNVNDVNAEWVCRNSKTGDTMIIASEINSRLPEQTGQQPNYPQQPSYPQQPTDAYIPNTNNPWLGTNFQQPQQNDPDETLPEQNNPQNPIFNNGNRQNSYPEPLPTEPPVILTTKSSAKSPFPTLENIDWTKYVETTTKRTSAPSLNSAIDGEGIFTARAGNQET